MILRDGRNQEHDLGPRRTFEPSLMTMIGSTGNTGTGTWNRDMLKSIVSTHDKRAYDNAHRANNRERYLEKERERSRRRRERQRAASRSS